MESRRSFMKKAATGAAAVGASELILKSRGFGRLVYAAGNVIKNFSKKRSLKARIEGSKRDATIDDYLREYEIPKFEMSSRARSLLEREDIQGHIAVYGNIYKVPVNLLAAIITEENSSPSWMNRGYDWIMAKYVHHDSTIGITNMKLSTAAYYMEFTEKLSKKEFDSLPSGVKDKVFAALNDDNKSIELAAKYLNDLRKSFKNWINRFIEPHYRIKAAEVPVNPIALVQLANGWIGGESLLDKIPREKAERMLSLLSKNSYIDQLFKKQIDIYQQKSKEALKPFMTIRSLATKIWESEKYLNQNQHAKAYEKCIEAYDLAYNAAAISPDKNDKKELLIYSAYLSYYQGRILEKANTTLKIKLNKDTVSFDYKKDAPKHYKQAIKVLDEVSELTSGVEFDHSIYHPKIGEKGIPNKKELRKMINNIK